jgi:hypothetical protein
MLGVGGIDLPRRVHHSRWAAIRTFIVSLDLARTASVARTSSDERDTATDRPALEPDVRSSSPSSAAAQAEPASAPAAPSARAAVLGLIPHGRARAVEHRLVDLLP